MHDQHINIHVHCQNADLVTGKLTEALSRLEKIMSQLDDFKTAVDAAFEAIGTAIDGVTADIDFLKAEIVKLQESQGVLSPEDQAILDGIQTRAEAVSDTLAALDAMTEPPTP